MKLMKVTKIEIFPSSPFHFDSTFYKPGHFPTADTKWQPGKRWQTMLWQGERLGLIFEDKRKKQSPKVLLKVFSNKELSLELLDSLKKEIIWRFNIGLDLSGFYRDVGNDPLLKPIIKKFYGLRPMHAGSLYEYLTIAIVLQNAAVKRSVNMMQSLFENYGSAVEFDGKKFWCFWEPKILAETSEQKLRDLKFGYRAKFLIKVSTPFARSELNEFALREKSSAEQEKILLSLYGIGPASVGYIMFDVFHRFDYLKQISPWEQKIYTKIFFNKDYEKELVPVSKMLKRFEKWGKWKAMAVNYIWESIWWKRRYQPVLWLEKLIRL